MYNSAHRAYDVLNEVNAGNGRMTTSYIGTEMTSYGDFNSVQTTEAALTEATSRGANDAVYFGVWQNQPVYFRYRAVSRFDQQ